MGMESDHIFTSEHIFPQKAFGKYIHTKNTCNVGFYEEHISNNHPECRNFSRREVFYGKQCVGSVAYDKNKCTLNYLYVLDQFQGMGLGKTLFFKAIKDMKKHGCPRVTWASTSRAENFYKKLGAHYLNGGMYIDIEKEK